LSRSTRGRSNHLPISDLFSFLGSGERQTLERIIKLQDMSIETSQHLLLLLQRLKDHDYGGVDREFAIITDLERSVEDEHRSLVRLLCTGSFFGGIREDIINLVGLVEHIAHASKHSAMMFRDMKLPQDVVDYFFQEDVPSFISTCIAAAQLLNEAIKALEKNKDEVLSLAEEIEKKESEADAIQHNIVRHLFKNEINAKSLDITVLKDFLHMADDIADDSASGSEVLSILVAKGYS
jgi:predicted phosphate transport protein (TIGR00153 family)